MRTVGPYNSLSRAAAYRIHNCVCIPAEGSEKFFQISSSPEILRNASAIAIESVNNPVRFFCHSAKSELKTAGSRCTISVVVFEETVQ